MKKLDNYSLLKEEALLSTANGYVGMRANFEEGYINEYKTTIGTYINGFYDTVPICYDEMCIGFPTDAQKMVNVHNAQGLRIYIDGDLFNVFDGELKDIKREIDIKKGYAQRTLNWKSPKGHNLSFVFKRMASFVKLELITIDVTIKSEDYDGQIQIVSRIDGTVINSINDFDPRAGDNGQAMLNLKNISYVDNSHTMTSETRKSNLSISTACSYNKKMEFSQGEKYSEAKHNANIKSGESVRFIKYIGFADSIRHKNIEKSALNTVEEAVGKGIDYFYEKQKEYLDDFWQYSYIEVDDKENVEYAINYSLFQLLASAGKDKHCLIGAKGLSGGGYDGHYFWDTEIYMIPFFTLTMPDVARTLLKFRYNTLSAAKDRALEMGHKKGAKIPWRTISGSECSAYFPAGSAQYHINADVAYAYIQYYLFTNDIAMIKEFGYEVVFETARIWIEVGNYNSEGEFCINTVTGPDEYTVLVDNNYYTNSMAKYHLKWAVELGEVIKNNDVSIFNKLCIEIEITEEEIAQMKRASENMRLPFNEELNIHLQDDNFWDKPEWNFDDVPKENYPLLLHYHPLNIYRHKVLKQADTILSYVLLDDANEDVMRNSYYYYKNITTHDSSLSMCVHSMMAARIGDSEEAHNYFMSTIRMDLDDINKNTKDGLHIANAGGAYMAMVYGFGGLRIMKDGLHLRPIKPKAWGSYSFRLNYRSQIIKIYIGEEITISCEKPIQIYIYDMLYIVDKELKVILK